MQYMQQIIVYRNPIEAYIWNSGQAADLSIFLVCFIVMIIGIVLSHDYMLKYKIWYTYRSKISIVIGTICAIVTWYLIHI